MSGAEERDHLFISYATEDFSLAQWLTLKLTACGYRVWCDQVKLLGGESYPRDIDVAIKERTFRMLALMSASSISKPNPVKERTLAHKLASARKEDFVIPLKVDGISPADLDWMTTDLTFIPFDQNWAAGLRQLLKRLDEIDAPRPLKNGSEIAATAFLPGDIAIEKIETVRTNCYPIEKIPQALIQFRPSREVSWPEIQGWNKAWPCFLIDPKSIVAFGPPPAGLADGVQFREMGKALWRDMDSYLGASTNTIVTFLLRRAFRVKCVERGLILDDAGDAAYFPRGLLPKDKVKFRSYSGRNTWVQVVGDRANRRFTGETVQWTYHLGVRFIVRKDIRRGFTAVLATRVSISTLDGKPVDATFAQGRRKYLTKSWRNHHWFSRQIAIYSHLVSGSVQMEIDVGGDQRIVVAGEPIAFDLPISIDEDRLTALRKGLSLDEFGNETDEFDESIDSPDDSLDDGDDEAFEDGVDEVE